MFSYILLLLVSTTFFSCTKSDPMGETKMIQFSVTKIFEDSPPINVYMDDELIFTLGRGGVADAIILPEGRREVTLTLKKKDDEVLLADTVITLADADLGLVYMYSELLGFNKFVDGNEFKRPTADSLSVQFYNAFDYGSRSSNIYVHKVDHGDAGSAYNPAVPPAASFMNVPFNATTGVVTLPAYEADGVTSIRYAVVVDDAVTGYNGLYDYMVDAGLDPYEWLGFPINTTTMYIAPGRLGIIRVENLPYYDPGLGKDYEQLWLEEILLY